MGFSNGVRFQDNHIPNVRVLLSACTGTDSSPGSTLLLGVCVISMKKQVSHLVIGTPVVIRLCSLPHFRLCIHTYKCLVFCFVGATGRAGATGGLVESCTCGLCCGGPAMDESPQAVQCPSVIWTEGIKDATCLLVLGSPPPLPQMELPTGMPNHVTGTALLHVYTLVNNQNKKNPPGGYDPLQHRGHIPADADPGFWSKRARCQNDDHKATHVGRSVKDRRFGREEAPPESPRYSPLIPTRTNDNSFPCLPQTEDSLCTQLISLLLKWRENYPINSLSEIENGKHGECDTQCFLLEFIGILDLKGIDITNRQSKTGVLWRIAPAMSNQRFVGIAGPCC